MERQSTQFYFVDNDPGVTSFKVEVQIWSVDNNTWQQENTGILGVNPGGWVMEVPHRKPGELGPSINCYCQYGGCEERR